MSASDIIAYLIAAVIVGGIFLGALGFSYWASSTSCYKKYPSMKPSYALFEGCMIEVNNQRIPSDKWRVIE